MKVTCWIAQSVAAGVVFAGFVAAGCAAGASPDVVRPEAKAQTEAVPHRADAADDPAIWVHPKDPNKSLILATDKRGALHVYNMDGSGRQTVSDGSRPNNVDVLYGFRLGGRTVDIAVASVRARASRGVKVWSIDAGSGKLSDVTAGGIFKVFGGRTPYGLCTYRSAKDGKCYFFVNDTRGRVEQCLLADAGGGRIKAAKVRELKLKSTTEGCVADDELGWFYIAEESVGIWKFPAEPGAPKRGRPAAAGRLVARVGRHGLKADVEGLTIYYASGGKGYLIASSQGNDTFKVYARGGDNRYLLTIDPKAGKIDDVSDTDGIAVTNRPTSRQFPAGFLIVQDDDNAGGNQNFKLYDWRDIAGRRLLVDTKWDPRRVNPDVSPQRAQRAQRRSVQKK